MNRYYNISQIQQDVRHVPECQRCVASVQSPNPHQTTRNLSTYMRIYGLYLYRPNVNTYYTYIWPMIYTYVAQCKQTLWLRESQQVSITSPRITNAKTIGMLEYLEYRNINCDKYVCVSIFRFRIALAQK